MARTVAVGSAVLVNVGSIRTPALKPLEVTEVHGSTRVSGVLKDGLDGHPPGQPLTQLEEGPGAFDWCWPEESSQ
jgi:hypothetical protein